MSHERTAAKFPRGTLIYDQYGPATVLSCTDGCMPFVLSASFVDNPKKPFCIWSRKPVTPGENWPFPAHAAAIAKSAEGPAP